MLPEVVRYSMKITVQNRTLATEATADFRTTQGVSFILGYSSQLQTVHTLSLGHKDFPLSWLAYTISSDTTQPAGREKN